MQARDSEKSLTVMLAPVLEHTRYKLHKSFLVQPMSSPQHFISIKCPNYYVLVTFFYGTFNFVLKQYLILIFFCYYNTIVRVQYRIKASKWDNLC